MILTTGLLLILAAEILTGIVLTVLPWSRIKGWFQERAGSMVNLNHLRISLHEKLATGQHRVVYGIFNKQTSTFLEGESVTADQIGPEIAALHDDAPLVVFS